MKILIAEDDATSRSVLEAILRKWEYEPVAVTDGESAWQILQQDDPPKLLLLDWMMPELSGVELCKRIRNNETEDPCFIILLTSRTSTVDIVTGLAAGANEYIVKPFDKTELQARIQVGKRLVLLQAKQREAEKTRIQLQRELAQTNKMEALGQITGSIAHDFNNILGITMGYTSLALNQFENEIPDKMKQYLLTAMQASERAKELVEKMLTYTHGDTKTTPEPLQLAIEIENCKENLVDQLPETINVQFHIEENIPEILLSHSALQQLLLNFCDNAKEALDDQGIITIDVGKTSVLDAECLSCHKLLEGDWIEIAVTDTGAGMSTETIEQIFDPFYTTKELGKGMGMSMSRGIVHTAGGHFLIESTLGEGSKIRILFPPVENK